jgi:hypothetical protein
MFVSSIIRRSRNNQHYAQICTTALFYRLVPACIGSSLPSSGSFPIRLSCMKIQTDLVVYHIMLYHIVLVISTSSRSVMSKSTQIIPIIFFYILTYRNGVGFVEFFAELMQYHYILVYFGTNEVLQLG